MAMYAVSLVRTYKGIRIYECPTVISVFLSTGRQELDRRLPTEHGLLPRNKELDNDWPTLAAFLGMKAQLEHSFQLHFLSLNIYG